MRNFSTGATRDSDAGKLDYDGFFCPAVLERRAQYMHKHRIQPDGNLRDSSNWQKGIPIVEYRRSLWRHFRDLWALAWGLEIIDEKTKESIDIETAICSCMFNLEGWLHELLKAKREQKGQSE